MSSVNSTTSIIILAAGKGTRMKSSLPKVLHKVAGREMVNLVIDSAKAVNPKNITLVVSQDILDLKQQIQQQHNDINLKFVLQEEKLGTGHAVKVALEEIAQDIGDRCLVLYGDTPLLSADTIIKMSDKIIQCDICVAAFDCFESNMYGRLVTGYNDNLEQIVEFKDASAKQKQISLCNSGIMAIAGDKIADLVAQIDNNNAAQEYYLTDLIRIATEKNLTNSFIKIDGDEVLGVNSKIELAQVENIKQQQLRHKIMVDGVTLIDPNSTYFAFDTKIGQDCLIQPNVFFGTGVKIGNNNIIKSFSHLENCHIGNNCQIGPMARIRPNTEISDDCKIGNFVEIKKSKLAKEVKVSHLSYIGDSEIDENSNIGAGTITCNYDGQKKFKTKIGKNSFIGSNCALIAPIEIGDNCLIGAGSTINKNVENGDMAIARNKQVNITNGAKKVKQQT